MKITLPLPPNRSNARWHWRTEYRKKLDYWLRCDIVRDVSDVEHAKRWKVNATLYLWAKMDPDNLSARLKWPLDWLVHESYIRDDSADVIELSVSQAIDRKRPRVVFDMEPIR